MSVNNHNSQGKFVSQNRSQKHTLELHVETNKQNKSSTMTAAQHTQRQVNINLISICMKQCSTW